MPEREKKKILVADDVELNRVILGELFKNKYDILEAENGQQVLELLDKHPENVEIILLDIIMPKVNGIKILEKLHADGNKIPVIMITAEYTESASLQCYELGASDIIQKPFNPAIVRQRVENIIELYSYRHDLENMVNRQTEKIISQAEKISLYNDAMVNALGTLVEFRDINSKSHIYRIKTVTKILLEEMSKEASMSEETIHYISQASVLHDLGKISIPDTIIKKQYSALSPEELEIFKTHPQRGLEILDAMNFSGDDEFFRYIREICLYHHERYDGGGYPTGISGDEIPMCAQVVSLADTYDVLVNSCRTEPVSHSEAIELISSGQCGAFNPRLVDFLKLCSGKIEESYQSDPEQAKYPINSRKRSNDMDSTFRMLELLEKEREKYRFVTDSLHEILFEYNMKTGAITFSENYEKVFGNNSIADEILSMIKNLDITHEHSLKDAPKLSDKAPRNFSIRAKVISGEYKWFNVSAKPITNSNASEIETIVGKISNIDDFKNEIEHWHTKASLDPLTNLFNRGAFERKVRRLLKEESDKSSAIMFIDIDNFKNVNDSFGHNTGDALLKVIAQCIQNNTRSTDIVARLGGDEFVIFLRRLPEIDFLQKRAESFRQMFLNDLQTHDETKNVSGSMGIALYPSDADNYDDLMNNADKALYYAKSCGKNTFRFYSEVPKNI